ncbi:MAG: hypothetical protein ACTSRW_13155 [Candidatus Helarchaeota archaeon]
MRLFHVVTGLKPAFNTHLKKIYLISLNEVKNESLDLIRKTIEDEFDISVEDLHQDISFQRFLRGIFLNTSGLARKFKKIPREKGIALMGATNYWLVPTYSMFSRIIHSFQPILGVSYVMWGICFVSTLSGKIKPDYLQFAAKHEVGHLLGKHGYPLSWLQKAKKQEKNE